MADAAVEMLFGGIQAAGGAALAVYTYKTSANPIWSIGYSGVALDGACNVFRSVVKMFRKSPANGRDDSCTTRNVVTGTLIYCGSLYGFSEAWKCNDKLWTLCLGTAVSGFYFAVASMKSRGRRLPAVRTQRLPLLKKKSALGRYLKFCQVAFEPVLSVCGTIYLSYFGNHEEEYLFWVPILLTGATGLKVGISAFTKVVYIRRKTKLLLKTFEINMGGWLLTISSTILAVYGSSKQFPISWRACMVVGACIGVFQIFVSVVYLMKYFDVERLVLGCFNGMMFAHILFFTGCLMIKYIKHDINVFLAFLFLAGSGHGLLWASFYDLYHLVPREVFDRYCQRVLGALLTVYGSAGSVYISHTMGWRSSLPVMTLVPAGVYIAWKGFRTVDQN